MVVRLSSSSSISSSTNNTDHDDKNNQKTTTTTRIQKRSRFYSYRFYFVIVVIVWYQLTFLRTVSILMQLKEAAGSASFAATITSTSTSTSTTASASATALEVSNRTTQTSTAVVLKEMIKFAASDLDLDSFDNNKLFPPVGVVRDKRFECKKYPLEPEQKDVSESEWHKYLANEINKRGGRPCEFIQEMGFIKFFRHNYPRMFFVVGTDYEDDGDGTANANHPPSFVPDLNLESKGQERVQTIHFRQLRSLSAKQDNLRVFLPLCTFLQSSSKILPAKKGLIAAGAATVPLLQAEVRPNNIFYIAAHPGVTEVHWEQPIRNVRKFQIDPTIVGSTSDVFVPVGTTPNNCDYSRDNSRDKHTLIYGCGAEHSYSNRYKGWRDGLFEIFKKLNKTDVNVAAKRSTKEYENGFYQSKFCFVIPGDTTATSQATRAMVAGCVPVFLVADFRELPFSNVLDYSQFAIRMHGDDLLLNDHQRSGNDAYDNDLRAKAVSSLYDRLQSMVTSGEYEQLRINVRIARDFFNYHRFGSRSPYGLAMVSMYQNEIDEKKS